MRKLAKHLMLGWMGIVMSACQMQPVASMQQELSVSLLKWMFPKQNLRHYPSSYRVRGRTYRVMRSSLGYRERGIASWYADHRRTSSGERYNKFALTAAHRSLPLLTYLRVKNLENGRQVIVKVNDRGPFRPNRIIDLSYAAASKLGLLSKGTARVEIEAITQYWHRNLRRA